GGKPARRWPVRVPGWRGARRPAGRHPPHPPGPGPGDGRRAGRGARGLRADRPARPRGAGHGRHPRLLPAGAQRRLVPDRRRPHRPQRPDRRRGPGAVPAGRPVVAGHARGQGGAAQAGAGAARDVPGRGRGGRLGRGARPGPVGGHTGAAAPVPRRPAAGRRGRAPGRARLRRPRGAGVGPDGPPARARVQELGLVPGRRHRRRAADLPGRPGAVGDGHRPAGRAPGGLRPGGGLARGRGGDGRAARRRAGPGARRPPGDRLAAEPLRPPPAGGGAPGRRPGRGRGRGLDARGPGLRDGRLRPLRRGRRAPGGAGPARLLRRGAGGAVRTGKTGHWMTSSGSHSRPMSHDTSAPTIEAVGLRKRFGEVEALAGLDLVAEPGRVLAVLGPNGAGKTTFVRTLATLVRPDAGELRVAGVDALRHPERVRRAIGLAGQYAAVEQAMTGRENLRMVARLFGHDRRRARAVADAVIERLELAEAGDRLERTYPGGMRRRLDLGASLVGAPRLLLLDEPTTGLDPRSRNELWDAIRALVATGTDVLLTTQYLDEADQLAHRIVIVDHGRVIADGTPGELKSLA